MIGIAKKKLRFVNPETNQVALGEIGVIKEYPDWIKKTMLYTLAVKDGSFVSTEAKAEAEAEAKAEAKAKK